MTLNFGSFCPYLPTAGIIGMYHNARFKVLFLDYYFLNFMRMGVLSMDHLLVCSTRGAVKRLLDPLRTAVTNVC